MHYRIRRNYLIYKTSFWWICFCLFLFYCLPSFIHTRPSVTCYCRTYCLCVLSYTDICRCALCIFQHELHIYIYIYIFRIVLTIMFFSIHFTFIFCLNRLSLYMNFITITLVCLSWAHRKTAFAMCVHTIYTQCN